MPENRPSILARLDTDRILGVLVMIGGLAAMYYYIVRQAVAATRHDPGVFLSLKGVTASPVVFAIGVVYATCGRRFTESLGDNKKRPTRTTWMLITLFCVADGLLYFWLEHFIEGYGYVFSF